MVCVSPDSSNLELLVMPVTQETKGKKFLENAHLQHPRRYHEFFLRSRPYRGEPPTVAGYLLYPDKPARMKTTSQEAFSFRPAPQNRDEGHDNPPGALQSTQQESLHPCSTSSRQTGKGNSSRHRQAREDERDDNHQHSKSPGGNKDGATIEMKSQYQRDFPPPSSCLIRRTPALPQPDNIGINPAFRFEFNTVQREAYPGWPIMNPRPAVSSREPSSRQAGMSPGCRSVNKME
ncbi:unnamed protein product [Menidia menidia]|uniref:(Atlantic silverside) hypothetical protein n=1 Tax=Menidia menidia TaxID=238744 RepID=A0A8S4AJL6_9TELE|nr:unnamed protein product [Menidia menidia]